MSGNEDEIAMRVVELNHDRYKTYFTQFIALHFGIFLALYQTEDASAMMKNLQEWIPLVGFVLALIWWRVQVVIRNDIKQAWKLINAPSTTTPQSLAAQLFKLSDKTSCMQSSSWAMNLIPPIVGLIYLRLLLPKFFDCL